MMQDTLNYFLRSMFSKSFVQIILVTEITIFNVLYLTNGCVSHEMTVNYGVVMVDFGPCKVLGTTGTP